MIFIIDNLKCLDSKAESMSLKCNINLRKEQNYVI